MTLHQVINKLDTAKRAVILSTVLREGTTVHDFIARCLAEKAERLLKAQRARTEEETA